MVGGKTTPKLGIKRNARTCGNVERSLKVKYFHKFHAHVYCSRKGRMKSDCTFSDANNSEPMKASVKRIYCRIQIFRQRKWQNRKLSENNRMTEISSTKSSNIFNSEEWLLYLLQKFITTETSSFSTKNRWTELWFSDTWERVKSYKWGS